MDAAPANTLSGTDTFDAIRQRRAIKRFDPEHRMHADEVRALMELTLLSPTSFNIQNWRFVLVQDAEQKRRLRAASSGQPQLEEASLVVILCADLRMSDRLPGYGRAFYAGKERVWLDEAQRSCGLAGQTLMLAAQALGYDSCPMVGFDPEAVAEIIALPPEHLISFIVTIGKKAAEPKPRAEALPYVSVVLSERFPE